MKPRNKIAFALFISLVISLQTRFAFNQNIPDSLYLEIKKNNDVANKITLYLELNKYFINNNIDSAERCNSKALHLAEKYKCDTLMAKIYSAIGRTLSYKCHYDSAEKCFLKTLQIYQTENNTRGIATEYNNLGVLYFNKSLYAKSVKHYQKALEYNIANNDTSKIATSYNNIGIIHYFLSDYENALNYYYKALKMREKTKENKAIASTLSNIALVYKMLGDYDKALLYSLKAIKIYEKSNDTRGMGKMYNNIASLLLEKNKLDDAEKYLKLSKASYEKLGNLKGLTAVMTNFGNLKEKQKNYSESIKYFNTALELAQKSENHISQIKINLNLADIYTQKNNDTKAKQYINIAIAQCLSLQDTVLLSEAYFALSEIFAKEKQYQQASEMFMKHAAIDNKIVLRSSSEKIAELQLQYDINNIQNEINTLNIHNKAQQEKIDRRRLNEIIAVSILAILITLFIIMVLMNLQSKRKTNFLNEQKQQITESTLKIENQKEKILSQKDKLLAHYNSLEKINHELEKYALIIKNTDNSIILINKNGEIEWVNDGFLKIYGYESLEDFKQSKGDTIFKVSDNNEIEKKINYCIEHHKSVIYTTKNKTKQKQTKYIQTTLTPIKNEKDELIYLAAIESDYSYLKNALVQIKNMKQDQDLIKLKSAFIANVSHEVRTPLNAIIGFSSILKEKELPNHIDQKINNIITNGEALLQFLNDIIHLAKTFSDTNPLKIHPFVIKNFIQNLHSLYSIYTDEKNIQFILEIKPMVPEYIFIDQYRFRQVLFNLLGNALKYTSKGFIKISFDYIKNYNDTLEDVFLTEIIDTGDGFRRDILNDFNSSFETKKPSEHFGMGFNVVFRFILMMNGKLKITSEELKGTSIRIILPIQTQNTAHTDEINDIKHHTIENRSESSPASYQKIFEIHRNELSDETIINLPEIINLILTEYMKEYYYILKTQKINLIISFAEKIKEFGEIHHLKQLKMFGDRLHFEAKNFNIKKINDLLKIFPEIITNLEKFSISNA